MVPPHADLPGEGGTAAPEGAADLALSKTAPSRASVIAGLTIVQFLFGVHYFTAKLVLGSFPALVWASLRAGTTALLLLLYLGFSKRKAPRLSREFLKQTAGLACLGVMLNQACFLIGLAHTTATNSAVLNTTVPLFTLALAVLFGKERMTLPLCVGLLLSASGVLSLVGAESFQSSRETLLGDGFTLLNCVLYASFMLLSRDFLRRHDAIWVTFWLFAFGSVGLFCLAIPEWVHFRMPPLTASLVGAGAFVILGATVAAYLLLNWCLPWVPASRAALFVYLQPLVAAFLSVQFLGEKLSARTGISSALILVGVYLAVRRRPVA